MTTPDALAAPEEKETFLVARTQVEMQLAQEKLKAWALAKVAEKQAELVDAEANLAAAVKSKWKTAPFRRLADLAKKKVVYYEKAKAALDEGYAIIPDMGVDVFAIRTTASVKPNETTTQWNRPQATDQETNSPPLLEGDFVTPKGIQSVEDTEVAGSDGALVPAKTAWTEEHDFDIDFPFRKVKPMVLEMVDKALKEKIFDEIGVLPKYRTQPDPVVVGRIVYKEGYRERRMNFLITWFIDTKEL